MKATVNTKSGRVTVYLQPLEVDPSSVEKRIEPQILQLEPEREVADIVEKFAVLYEGSRLGSLTKTSFWTIRARSRGKYTVNISKVLVTEWKAEGGPRGTIISHLRSTALESLTERLP